MVPIVPPCSPSWSGLTVAHRASSSPFSMMPPPRSLPRFLCNAWWIPAAGRCFCAHLSLRSCIAASRRGQREVVGSFGGVQSRMRAGRSVTLPQTLTWSKDGARMNGLASFQHSGISPTLWHLCRDGQGYGIHLQKPAWGEVRGKAGPCNGQMGLCHPSGMSGGGKREPGWAEAQAPCAF